LQALVKVSFLKMHLVSQGLPYSNERGVLIDFGRVVSEWVTWALVGGGRRSEANHDCDDGGQYRDTHFLHAFRGAAQPLNGRHVRYDCQSGQPHRLLRMLVR
jgi:hypothetical protein